MSVDWAAYHAEIEALYIIEDKTANETIEIINKRHGINITPRQFKAQYSGLKNLKAKEWKAVISAVRRGEAEGKAYDVYLLNRLQSRKRVERAFNLYEKKIHTTAFTGIDFGIDTVNQHRVEIRTSGANNASVPRPMEPETRPVENTDEPQGDDVDPLIEEVSRPGFAEVMDIDGVEISLRTPQAESSFPNFLSEEFHMHHSATGQISPVLRTSFLESPLTVLNPLVSPSLGLQRTSFEHIPSLPSFQLDTQPTFPFLSMNNFDFAKSSYISFWEVPDNHRVFPALAHNSGVLSHSILSFFDCFAQLDSGTSTRNSNVDTHLAPSFEPVLRIKEIISSWEDPPSSLYKHLDQQSLNQIFSITSYLSLNNKLEQRNVNIFSKWVLENHFAGQLASFLQQTHLHGRHLINQLTKVMHQGGHGANPPPYIPSLLKSNPNEYIEIIRMADPRIFSQRLWSEILEEAVDLNNDTVISFLVQIEGNSRQPVGYDYRSPLEYIIRQSSTDMLRLLIDSKVIEKRTLGHALIFALEQRQVEPAKYLLKAVAEVFANDRVDDILIMDWLKERSPKIFDILREMIVHNEETENYFLTKAAEKGNRHLSQHLLSFKIIPAELLERVLCYAITKDSLMAVRTLLSRGVDPGMQKYRARRIESGDDTDFLPSMFCKNTPNRAAILYVLRKAGLQVDISTLQGCMESTDKVNLLTDFAMAGFDIQTVGPSALEFAMKGYEEAPDSQIFRNCCLWLDRGAPVNEYGLGGLSALQSAAQHGNLPMMAELIERGADVNLPASEEGGLTALQAAALSGDPDVVDYLLDAHADCGAPPAKNDGLTVLEAATQSHSPYCEIHTRLEICKNLVCNGASLNRLDGTASRLLVNVIELGWMEHLVYLLKAGANPHGTASIEEGDLELTPLQAAAYHTDLRAIQLLIEHGADIHTPAASSSGRTALQAVLSTWGDDRIRYFTGRTTDRKDVVDWLLTQGVNVNDPPAEEYGRTALQAAASNAVSDPDIVQLLLDHNADPNAPASKMRGITALQGAAIQGHLRITEILLAQGAEVNAPPSEVGGRTAIEGAAEHGRMEMVKLLLNHGANSTNGFSRAIKLADDNEHWHIAEFLEGHVALQNCFSLEGSGEVQVGSFAGSF